MNLTVVLDHTALIALYRADPFLTGLCIEASRGTGRVIVPSLSVLLRSSRTRVRAGTRRFRGERSVHHRARRTTSQQGPDQDSRR